MFKDILDDIRLVEKADDVHVSLAFETSKGSVSSTFSDEVPRPARVKTSRSTGASTDQLIELAEGKSLRRV